MNINDINLIIPSNIPTLDIPLYSIKDQDDFLDYYNILDENGLIYGWTGNLDTFTLKLTTSYLFLNNTDYNITLELNGVIQPVININLGLEWNYLGYPSITQNDIKNVIVGSNEDSIKDQEYSADYYTIINDETGEIYGWFPYGFNLKPGIGYLYKSVDIKTITINN
jgi:hypothetical protein